VKILELKIDNIGGIEAFELDPKGEHVIIGGKNEAGKSTILKAIAGALGGGKNRPKRALRDGAEKGEVTVDLGEYKIRWRTNAAGNDYLTVTDAEGRRYPSAQKLLERLWGDRTFDPLAFFKAAAKEQSRILADLAGIDLESLDKERKALFTERTAVNRLARDLEGQAAGYTIPEGTPEEPVDVSALADEIREGHRVNDDLAKAQQHADELSSMLEASKVDVEEARESARAKVADISTEIDRAIAEAKRQLQAMKAGRDSRIEEVRKDAEKAVTAAERHVSTVEQQYSAKVESISGLDPVNVEALAAELRTATDVNRAVGIRTSRDQLLANAEDKGIEAAALTAKIDEIDARKAEAIAGANLPIDGLGLADGAVTLEGRPLSDLSESQRLRLSVALGVATNPEIGVMLVDKWNDLDASRRAMVIEMADAAGCQIWATVVGADPDATVTIREGRIEESQGLDGWTSEEIEYYTRTGSLPPSKEDEGGEA